MPDVKPIRTAKRLTMSQSAFINFASADATVAEAVCSSIEARGISCWIAPRDIRPGDSWGESIANAISNSQVLVVLLSSASNESAEVVREVRFAVSRNIAVVAFRIEDVLPSRSMAYLLAAVQWLDGFGNREAAVERLVQHVLNLVPTIRTAPSNNMAAQPPQPESKGYVFLSYIRQDIDFVQRLRGVFRSKGYSFWDYLDGDRDYHGALYRELEERIDNAVAFITIVTDGWRASDWIAAEFIYAREAGKPIFVVQAKTLTKPLPILLNLQTRIDMSDQFDLSVATLRSQLEKKGL